MTEFISALFELLKKNLPWFEKWLNPKPKSTEVDDKLKKDAETGRPSGFWDEKK